MPFCTEWSPVSIATGIGTAHAVKNQGRSTGNDMTRPDRWSDLQWALVMEAADAVMRGTQAIPNPAVLNPGPRGSLLAYPKP